MAVCNSSLRLPTDNRVPCTRLYDHLETHACVVGGVILLAWGMGDNGKGLISGGVLAPLFPEGCWPPRVGEDDSWVQGA